MSAVAVASPHMFEFSSPHPLHNTYSLSSTSLSEKWQSVVHIEELTVADDESDHDTRRYHRKHHTAPITLHLDLPRRHGIPSTMRPKHGSLPLPRSTKASSRKNSKSNLSTSVIVDTLPSTKKDERPYTKYLMPEPPCDSRTSCSEFRLREVTQHKRIIFRGMTNRTWWTFPTIEDCDQTVAQMRWERYHTSKDEQEESDIEDMIG